MDAVVDTPKVKPLGVFPGPVERRASLTDLRESMIRAPVAIGVVDTRWRVRRVSRDIENVLGYGVSECMGVGVFVAVHPEDLPTLFKALGHAIASQESASLELRLWHKKEGWVISTVVLSPLSPGSPFPFGFIVLPIAEPQADDLESRLFSLEMHMRRIASEVESAGSPVRRQRSTTPMSRQGVLECLSGRQVEIVERLLRGRRVPSIANELGISPSTVRNHLSQLFRKFGVASQAELVERFRASVSSE